MAKTYITDEYFIHCGHMGNGEVFWNTRREVNNDYEHIAHIAEDGTLTLYKKDIPDDLKEWLEEEAKDFAAQDPKWYRR